LAEARKYDSIKMQSIDESVDQTQIEIQKVDGKIDEAPQTTVNIAESLAVLGQHQSADANDMTQEVQVTMALLR